ncbi:transcriptional regulator BetI [Nocardia otitidiscaviarum]|uniref:Transcriptional regulator BetI n=1 Tax=Nocardia otitidiscaviarum TaxID=1823 RepID=A0A379JJ58_9NOCA|nr:TetR/AcrR family transcriptional regulator [Nocardia otitidiscaviarum]SUD48548.1 transcriptional regulator BetI [Nocardia otitidiscaviarum]
MKDDCRYVRAVRGRPRKSDAERAEVRQRILESTASVYVEHGHAGLTVERIARAAGMSKPTFYKYFPSSTAAMSELVAECNRRLRERIEAAVSGRSELTDKIDAGIDAYLDWSDEIGDALLVFRAEEAGSPAVVAGLRTESNAVYSGMIEALAADSNLHPAPEVIAMLLAAMQAGARQYQADPSRRAAVKQGMLRFAAIAALPSDPSGDGV